MACAAVARQRSPASSTTLQPGEGHFIADWVRMLDEARARCGRAILNSTRGIHTTWNKKR